MKIIDEEVASFYQQLYAERSRTTRRDWYAGVPRLSPEQTTWLSRPIRKHECERAVIKDMKTGKAPGNDGITVMCLRALWPTIGDYMMKSFEESIKEGVMATSQRQSVIRLIPKKDKSPLELKNWRPISLMNTDTKILAKALAERLKTVLPDLVSEEQNAYLSGRIIHDGTRVAQQVIEVLDDTGGKGVIISIDFQKAFDSVNLDYLWETMEAMGFGNVLIGMVKTLYKDAESAVMNMGKTTKYFKLERGARQGDPIAPYLFLIAIEPLLRQIKEQCRGVDTPGGTVTAESYADDLYTVHHTIRDAKRALEIIDEFGEATGLRLNKDKCQALFLGKWTEDEKNALGVPEVRMATITGLTVGSQKIQEELDEANFTPMLKNMKSITNLWKLRQISTAARITAHKSQGLAQLQHLAMATQVPEHVIQETAKLTGRFIWNGPDRIPRDKLAKTWEEGGMCMPMVQDVVSAAAMHWIRRALFNQEKVWAKNIILDLQKVGGISILGARVDTTAIAKLKSLKRRHVRYLLEKLRVLQGKLEKQKVQDDTPIFHNEEMTNGVNKGIDVSSYPRLYKIGLRRVSEFFDADGRILSTQEAIIRGLPRNAMFEWRRMCIILKKRGVEDIRCDKWGIMQRGQDKDRVPSMKLGNSVLPWAEATQKRILKIIASDRKVKLTPHQERMEKRHSINEEEWKNLYRYIKNHSIATRKRDFVYKLICMGPYTNVNYEKFGVKSSSACQYCGNLKQDFQHLFEECKEVNDLRDRLSIRWEKKPDRKEWLFGTRNKDDEEKAMTYIAIELIHYVQNTNWKEEELSLAKFKGKLRATEYIERKIAMKKLKMAQHDQKWDHIFRMLT